MWPFKLGRIVSDHDLFSIALVISILGRRVGELVNVPRSIATILQLFLKSRR